MAEIRNIPVKKLVPNNKRLSVLVKDQITEWIIDGTLQAGQKICEDDLAERLGVSRMPVREALRVMENMGMVESTPFVGSVIREFSKEELEEMYMLRVLLESTACVYAAERITPEAIFELERIQRNMDDVGQASHDFEKGKELHNLNREFHFKMYESANLPKLFSIIENLWEATAFVRIKSAYEPDYAQRQRAEHNLYMQLLRERKGDELRAIFAENTTKHMHRLKE